MCLNASAQHSERSKGSSSARQTPGQSTTEPESTTAGHKYLARKEPPADEPCSKEPGPVIPLNDARSQNLKVGVYTACQ